MTPLRLIAWLVSALACACLVMGCRAAPQANRVDAGAFPVIEAAPGVFVHLGRQVATDTPGHDDIANIGFIVGTSCVAVIDSGGSVRTGQALRAAIRARTRLPICYVINTHVHFDHLFGNAAFRDDHPQYVGHAALPAAMQRSRQFFLERFAQDLQPGIPEQNLVVPEHLVADTETLDLGGRVLTLHAYPPAHSECDLTVFDQRTRTLWTGDLLFRERTPAVTDTAKGWLQVISALKQETAVLAVPGHGTLSRDLPQSLATEALYLQALLDGCRADLAQGKALQQALSDVAVAEKSKWLLWDETHPPNVARVYKEVEWE